jgi:hypothetical protein
MAEVDQVFAMISASATAQQIAKGEAPSLSLMHLPKSPAFIPEQDAQHAPSAGANLRACAASGWGVRGTGWTRGVAEVFPDGTTPSFGLTPQLRLH